MEEKVKMQYSDQCYLGSSPGQERGTAAYGGGEVVF
ncbi:hypothetical protein M2135_001764 [Parabacteroides sp. PF5-9]|nr:hypothetical protein [Parabacteroides sp. PF5-9]